MQNNNIKNTIWKSFSVCLNSNDLLIFIKVIKQLVFKFWREIFSNLNDNEYLFIQLKIYGKNLGIRSITKIDFITKKDIRNVINKFLFYWELLYTNYLLDDIEKIMIVYKYPKLEVTNIHNLTDTMKSQISDRTTIYPEIGEIKKFRFGGYNLPSTMDFTQWGETIFFNLDRNAIVHDQNSRSTEYMITINNYDTLVDMKLGDKTMLRFKDSMRDVNNLGSFKRIIDNHEYIFENNELLYKSIIRKTKFITKIKPSIYLSEKYLTIDLETRVIDGKHIPFCISIYDGKEHTCNYLRYFNSDKDMLKLTLLSIFKRKYNGYIIYFHNFAHFDSVFIINILIDVCSRSNVKTRFREGRLIEIKVKFGKYRFIFRDSLLLLPIALSKLAIQFNIEHKGDFPFLFVNNKEIQLDYKGIIPSINNFQFRDVEGEYSDDKHYILKKYKEYCKDHKNKLWDLEYETKKYCNLDTKVLYEVIKIFSHFIFDEIRLDINKYPTLPSLSLGIFRCKFLGNHKLPIITGQMYKEMKLSYTGGAVDVFNSYGENLYYYDINSLYPYIMKTKKMPVGFPKYFEGNFLNIPDYVKKPFGIFEAEIITPENLNIPLLQTKIKINHSYKTITPLGNWKGTYLSDEIYKAIELGYKVNIIRGYIFEVENVYNEFVTFFYQIKENSKKNSPNYIISKMILNSLYGRLGMNPEMEIHKIIDSNDADKFYLKYNVSNIVELDNNLEIISYLDNDNEDDIELDNKHLNISIPSAIAITAYARLHMYKYKTMKDIKLYYTDTDSIIIDKELDSKFIGTEIGQLKLENKFLKGVFLTPKVYGGIINDNTQHIKIKGLKEPIKFDKLVNLLKKNEFIRVKHEKWFKNYSEGYINVKETDYTLMIKSGKRKLIYKNNILNTTEPLIIEDNKIINL